MNDRLKKVDDTGRRDRAMEDRSATESRDRSDAERIEMFINQFQDAALPNIPEIPGYHVCWLTTTNPRDTIQRRFQMGYEAVREEDVPHWVYKSQKTGEYAGHIAVNEMIACKIRLDLYQAIMERLHHDMPRAEEERMAETARAIRDRLQSSGAPEVPKIEEGDGYDAMRSAPPRPRFA